MNRIRSKLKDLVYNIAGPKYRDFVTISFLWEDIVGSLLAERAKILKIENQILFVKVSNSVWMQELALQKKIIIKKIEKRTGIQLKNIYFHN